ncbi:hypothetical protein EHS13_21005 [Paenibacillus psychroresistens]|uniref:Uncharacterized protein n=1 Tax=Paenibacillus psychroresistens TaxID=1778678 RepID=A0A6B8RNQ9_9BACL|nr:hypothetical protein [Paenibacillus psychroresistens]QGQ97185.1 hypothetical protein EHS13_21005 [Paenibacillus psychroresistens]
MKYAHIQKSLIRKFTLLASALLLIAASILTTGVEAAKQGVYANASVYFTLDNALLTAGTTTQTLSFTLNLINQSSAAVDLNQYGIRVMDKAGNKYSAQLIEKASARVLTKQTQGYKYTAQVPSNMTIGQFSINIFAWDDTSATYMRNLGSLDASEATTTKVASSTTKAIINLANVNAALPASSSASFELVRSYKVLKNNIWYLYSDFLIENLSAKAIQLPANLLFNLRDAAAQTTPISILSGANQTIQSKQLGVLTTQVSLAAVDTTGKLSLELTKKSVSSTTITTSLLASLSVDDSYINSQVGSSLLYITKTTTQASSMVANRTEYTYLPYSNEIAVDYTLKNEGLTSLTLPKLSAKYQVGDATIDTPAVDAEVHPLTLAAGESETYHFTANFPKATDTSTIELVVMEKAQSGTIKPINLVHLPASYSLLADSGFSETTGLDMKDFDASLSKYSMFSFQVIRSYNTTVDGKALINIDVIAKNQNASTLKLPTALAFTLLDSANLTYPTTVLRGGGQLILPHQSSEFTLQAAIGVEDKSKLYSLQLVKKAAASNSNPAAAVDTTSTSTTAADKVLDTLDLTSSFANTKSNSSVATTIGKLAVSLKSAYRLASNGSNDVLVSELEIQNVDTKTITLPSPMDTSLYGGYMLGDLDAQGKVIQIQSSPYLYPNQKTTIYIYAKIPYTSAIVDGYIYLGDGTWNSQAQTWSATHEWTEIPYTASTSVISSANLNIPWTLDTPGRASIAEVVDSQIYDINNQKMLAVRILQTNKEARNGSIVPYTGYLSGVDGSVLPLKTTDDSANTTALSKEGLALTTLWTLLPTGLAADNQQFIFGQKINADAFASPQQYAFTPSTLVSGGALNSVAVYPYTISAQNPELTLVSNSGVAGYEFSFDYTIAKALSAAGTATNRSLVYKLTDDNGVEVKSWEEALEGTAAWVTGKQTLTFTYSDVTDPLTFAQSPKHLKVYEKFEGGTRLLGSISTDF